MSGDDEISAAMGGHGFTAFADDSFARDLLAVPAVGDNTVSVRDKPAVKERLRSAGMFGVGGAFI